MSTPSAMTDQERDEIDSAAQDFIRSCSDKIENLHDKGEWLVHVHAVYVYVYMYIMMHLLTSSPDSLGGG